MEVSFVIGFRKLEKTVQVRVLINFERVGASNEISISNAVQRLPRLDRTGAHGGAGPPMAGDIKVRTTSKLLAIVFLIIYFFVFILAKVARIKLPESFISAISAPSDNC
ncbi:MULTISPECIES: hypothetical protein [unclassified Pseudomonas]|uniref:hypothetical protein n=1 Tax=unclassified Pseudomonas TaxID=196821 RepID=UPI002447D6DD|nr:MULTISPECIES: hypothetical protein [unclassified Pseudomonas]MDH0305348.1 hypothetical protein [Pseudomonas sp. GD04091]MDH1988282.1 hypothetical protein [Pseudomonas sp. GD03689]